MTHPDKPGRYGTLHAYRVVHTDRFDRRDGIAPSAGIWYGYDPDHAAERCLDSFLSDHDAECAEIVSVKRA
jgi:hypothetical protein